MTLSLYQLYEIFQTRYLDVCVCVCQDVVRAAFGRSGFVVLTIMQFLYPFTGKTVTTLVYLLRRSSSTYNHEIISKQDGKYSERVQISAKAFLLPTVGNTCHTYYFAAR